MGVSNSLQKGFDRLVLQAGRPISINYYNEVYDSTYDDVLTLTLSGTITTSGIILPINDTLGTKDNVLVQQGRLQNDDNKLYLSGGIPLTGSDTQIRIKIGNESYSVLNPGPVTPEAEATSIYKRVFIRRLTTGSLVGE